MEAHDNYPKDLPYVTREQFNAYRRVMRMGQFNMLLDPRAQQETGLDGETYMNCIKHYGRLLDLYGILID